MEKNLGEICQFQTSIRSKVDKEAIDEYGECKYWHFYRLGLGLGLNEIDFCSDPDVVFKRGSIMNHLV